MSNEDPHQRVVRALNGLNVSFEVLSCDPQWADTDVFCKHYGIPLEYSANTILVKSKSGERRFVACVLLADCQLDVNHTVRKKMGVRRISFASADETRERTGMVIGGVMPVPLPEDIELWVDSAVMNCAYIILGGGDRATKIKLAPELFKRTANTQIVPGLARKKE